MEQAVSAEEMEARLEELRRLNRELFQELLQERERRQRAANDAQAIINEYADKIARLEELVASFQGSEEWDRWQEALSRAR